MGYLPLYMAHVKKIVKNGRTYYELYESKRVNGKVKKIYKGYLGKSPLGSKFVVSETTLKPYVTRLLSIGISDEEILKILTTIGIKTDLTTIQMLSIELDRTRGKLFLRVR